jgi:hypothetical protein
LHGVSKRQGEQRVDSLPFLINIGRNE